MQSHNTLLPPHAYTNTHTHINERRSIHSTMNVLMNKSKLFLPLKAIIINYYYYYCYYYYYYLSIRDHPKDLNESEVNRLFTQIFRSYNISSIRELENSDAFLNL